MWRCPVCEKENTEMQCSRCGFDGSCDYEQYPSLGMISPGVDTIARRRDAIREKEKNILCCPSCGSGQFCFDMEMRNCICTECGFRFDWPENPEKNILKEKMAKTEDKVQKTKSLSSKLAQGPAKQSEGKEVSQVKTRQPIGAKLEKWTVILEMAVLPLQLVGWLWVLGAIAISGASLGKAAFFVGIIFATLSMRDHRLKKGFVCPRWLKFIWELGNSFDEWMKGKTPFMVILLTVPVTFLQVLVSVPKFILCILILEGYVAILVMIGQLFTALSFEYVIMAAWLGPTLLYWALWFTGMLRNSKGGK